MKGPLAPLAALASISAASAALPAGPLPGDTCASAIPISIAPGAQVAITGDSTAAPDDPGLPACDMAGARDSGVHGVWYRFTGTGDRVSIDTCAGPPLDLVLRVFCGSCSAPLCAAADDDGCDGSVTLNPRLALCTTPGAEYLLLVSSYSIGPGGPFVLTVTDGPPCTAPPACAAPGPANVSCDAASALTIGATVVGTTIDARLDAGSPACTGVALRRALWYTFLGNGRLVQAGACNPVTGSNAAIGVFSGSCSGLVCVAANDAASCADRADAPVAATFCSVPGVRYFVAVSDEVDGAGLFQLSLADAGPGNCSPTGACCTGTQCTIATRAGCTGSYLGDGSVCTLTAAPYLSIPDGDVSGVASTMVITGSPAPITDLNVGLLISHTWQGDLLVTLQHDNGPEIRLIDRPGYPQTQFGFSADNIGNPTTQVPFVVDDQAPSGRVYDTPFVPVPGTNNPTGQWVPDSGPLAAFNGQPLNGAWTLRVRDLATQDTGRLRSWSLIPTPPPVAPCTALGPDCFSRLVNGQPPTNAGNYTRGGPDGISDQSQCVGDWDRNGAINPADVADFVATWFYSVSTPGNLDADIDCSGTVVPADVGVFVSHWFAALQTPASEGC